MRTIQIVLILAVLTFPPVVAAENWSQYQHDAGHTGGYLDDSLDDTSRFHGTDSAVDTVFRLDEDVFFDTVDGDLYSVDAGDGSVNWVLEAEGNATKSPVVHGDRVFYSEGGDVFALDRETGETMWTLELETQVFPTPAYESGSLFFVTGSSSLSGSNDSEIYSVDADTGEVRWTRSTGGFTENDVSSGTAIAVRGDDLYVNTLESDGGLGSREGVMTALDASSGEVEWTFRGDAMLALPAADGSRVYTASWTGNLYALDAEEGSLVWNASLGDSTKYFPVYSRGTVFAGDSEGRVVAFEASSGSRKWRSGTGGRTRGLVVAGDRVYVTYRRGEMQAFDRDGAPLWNASLDHPVGGGTTVANHTVYVPTSGGFYALKEGSVESLLDTKEPSEDGGEAEDGEASDPENGDGEREDRERLPEDVTRQGEGLLVYLAPVVAALLFLTVALALYSIREDIGR